MKYLKYLIYLILALVIIFIGKGLLTPSVTYENEIMVDKSIQESWAVMSDEMTASQWVPGYIKSELVSGTANTVGAVSNIYMEENGEEMIIQETITALEENKHMAMTFTMDFMNMDYEMSLEEKEDGTLLKTKTKAMGNGILSKAIVSFMPSSMKRQEDENLVKLKAAIEENTKDYFPAPVVDSTTVVEEVME